MAENLAENLAKQVEALRERGVRDYGAALKFRWIGESCLADAPDGTRGLVAALEAEHYRRCPAHRIQSVDARTILSACEPCATLRRVQEALS